jgi:hypothetical protein
MEPCEKRHLKKIEIVSLVLVIVAVVVLIVGLQMDYGNTRKWMGMLFIALLMLAMDPTHFLKRKKKPKIVEQPIETEEDETGFIDLASPTPLDKNTLDSTDTYLSFLDKESEDYYYIHYVDGKADEVYVGWAGSLERQNRDLLYESYVALDDLFKTVKNEEIEDLCTISAEDFSSVRKRYQDQIVNYYQTSSPIQVPPEPVNRVGKVVGYLFLAFAFVVICTGAVMLPFMTDVDASTYVVVYFIFCLVLLTTLFYLFSPITWLERRIKWLMGSVNVKVETLGVKPKSYYADDKKNHITYEYHPWEKLMMITKTIQIPLSDARQTFGQQQSLLKEWVADKSFIEHCYMSDIGLLGVYYYFFTIPKADAKIAAIKVLREWMFLPAHNSSKVCECFKFEEAEGTFYVKYRDCCIDMLAYVPNGDGKTEVFDPQVNTLQDKSLSAELKRFFVDFEFYYAPRMKEDQRIELCDLPPLMRT